jgi:RNA polymerase sigma-70 factor (ECF subfamily)
MGLLMSQDRPFDELMARLRAGDDRAAAQVFHRFAHRLIALAQSRLDRAIRQKVDPEDVLQSVFQSFFRRHAEGQFELENWESLWSLLTVFTLRKCGHRVEHFRAARRDVRRETEPVTPPDESTASWVALARDPLPAEAAMLTETVEELLRGLGERDRHIVVLSLQGRTVPEISAQVGYAERTVQRVLELVKKWLERRQVEYPREL